MGQLAEDVVSGFMCSSCGVCFEKEHGHPVTCRDCWSHLTPAERKHAPPKAYLKEL